MFYQAAEGCVELSVRELCALAYKGGSLDTRLPSKSWILRAAEGRDVHRQLQASRGPDYHAEVMLRNRCRCGDLEFSVSGRADGVYCEPDGTCVVEEIKSVSGPAFGLAALYAKAPRARDLAQLSCYGYFLCVARGLPSVTLRLTYAEAGEEQEVAHTDAIMSADHLRELYVAMLAVILPQAQDLVVRETQVREACRRALFPYPEMRASQQDMIRECWRDMRRGQTLFAQAPTGIGKTISTLYPAVRCLGEKICDKIFYLTAKGSTRREAFAAAGRMAEAGTPVRACVITARESACVCQAARESGDRLTNFCNPDCCPYAKGYYDRVEGVITTLLDSGTLFSGLTIREAALAGRVCPYELALDLSERCEIVICDYNYVFSPQVYLRRYLADGIPNTDGHRYIFLVDEAHNLADRARDMYSGMLCLSDVTAAQGAMNIWEKQSEQMLFPDEDCAQHGRVTMTASLLDDLAGTLSRMAGRCAGTESTGSDGIRRGVSLEREAPALLCETVEALSRQCDIWLRHNPMHPLYRMVDTLAASLRVFRVATAYYDSHFVTFTETEGEEVRVRLVCLDPSGILEPILAKAQSRVLFSATLTPTDYFADILGGGKAGVTARFDSPFPPDHLCVAVADKISTRYEDRDASLRRVVSYIVATVSARPGNYMVCFPSYAYLEKAHALFTKKYPRVRTVVQTPGMTHTQREDFINAFHPDSHRLLIGFCVLGGSFSEGVDLPGSCLIGALIVGVGIPGLSNERNIMKEYYDETREGEGYAYAYTYPGMNHVLQAAGRVIRRPEDRGVVVLLDDRYLGEPYLHLYPPHWQNMNAVGDPASLAELLGRFWRTADGEGERRGK